MIGWHEALYPDQIESLLLENILTIPGESALPSPYLGADLKIGQTRLLKNLSSEARYWRLGYYQDRCVNIRLAIQKCRDFDVIFRAIN